MAEESKLIKKPITLRITAAEVLESQLSHDDLKALALADGNGNGNGGGVLCPTCYKGYSGPAIQALE
jgi:hypothetical protein